MYQFLKRLYRDKETSFISTMTAVKMAELEKRVVGLIYEAYGSGFDRGYLQGVRDGEEVAQRKVGWN